MKKLIKDIKVNGVEFNYNRDPQFYRRPVNEPFSIQARIEGTGQADVTLEIDGDRVDRQTLDLPARFDWETRFESAGTRVGQLMVECGGRTEGRDLRFDIDEHAWVG